MTITRKGSMSTTRRSLVSASIAFIGIGEGGCNLASIFAEMGYSVYYINSSMKDLKKIDPPKNMMFHVPLAIGTNRDRKLSKQYAKENYDIICDNIERKLGGFRYIFVCFSMGGGTGGGMSPILINGFIKRLPHIKFGTMAILPDSLSSPKMKFNATQCYSELKQIQGLGNSYFINNDNAIKDGKQDFSVTLLDESFANKFNGIVNLSSVDGSVDEEEVFSMLDIKGNTLVADILPTNALIENKIVLDISMTPVEKGCVYRAFSTNDVQSVMALAEEKFGKSEDTYPASGDSETDFVVSFGMAFPDETVYRLYANYREEMDYIQQEVVDNKFNFSDLGDFESVGSKRFTEEKVAPVCMAVDSQSILNILEDF